MVHTFIGTLKLFWGVSDDNVVNKGAESPLHPWCYVREDERLMSLLKIIAQVLNTLMGIQT